MGYVLDRPYIITVLVQKPQTRNTMSFKEKLMKVHRFYGVEILFLKPNVNRVQYIIECDYMGYHGSSYSYRLKRQQIFINSRPLTGMMDVLAEKCMTIVYPLILTVGFSGKILGVENLREVRERWIGLRKRLESEYSGKIIDEYLDRVEKALSNDKIFLQQMKRDILFKILVPRLYSWGSPSFAMDNAKIKIPHPNASCELIFVGKQEMNPYPDENGRIKVSFHGQYSESDLIDTPDDAKGTLALNYHLDNEDASMIRMNGQFEFKGKKDYKAEYKIVRLKERELRKE